MIKKILKIIFVLTLILLTKGSVLAGDKIIDSNFHNAKFLNDNYGSLDFITQLGDEVIVTNTEIIGNIWGDVVGWINLQPDNNGLKIDGNGEITGYAWGENSGWISFNCKNPDGTGDCSQNDNFHVSINSLDEFEGHAWSENYGWIEFDCGTTGECVKIKNDSSCTGGCGTTDYCPDIPGIQTSISFCPPPPPPPTDYCPDILGVQISPLECPVYDYCPDMLGIQTSSSDCPPPTDYCPDILGVQISPLECPVYDYCPDMLGIQTSSSDCPPPTDYCPDISGIQTSIDDCLVVVYQCNDEHDNDGDGLIDEQDPGCHTDDDLDKDYNPTDNTESNNVNTCYIIDGESPTLWQTINCMIDETIDHTKEILSDTWNQIKYVFTNPDGNILTKTIAITGLAFGTAFTLLPYLFSTPFSFSELVLMPYRLWSLLMSILGLRKRVRPWGTVYDSVTKQPLDPVVVDLFDAEGKKVQTSITDMDGRYGFLTDPGHYWMRPRKTHYSFPSFKLAGKTRDEIYLDLYFGNFFEVKGGEEVITKNIPMDREHFDWNEFAKKDQKLMKFYSKRDIWINRIADSLFSFGFFIAFIALVSSQSIYNIIIFALYLIMLIVRETGIKQKMFGRILTKDGMPLSFAVLKVFSTIGNIEVARKVANQYGKYYCLLQNGHYIVTIERKNADESYTHIYTSDTIEVKKGVINTHFKI